MRNCVLALRKQRVYIESLHAARAPTIELYGRAANEGRYAGFLQAKKAGALHLWTLSGGRNRHVHFCSSEHLRGARQSVRGMGDEIAVRVWSADQRDPGLHECW